MLISQIPSFSSYQGVSVPGERTKNGLQFLRHGEAVFLKRSPTYASLRSGLSATIGDTGVVGGGSNYYTPMFNSHTPSDSSYHGVSVPGEDVIISEAIISTTSISGLTYFFISFLLSPYLAYDFTANTICNQCTIISRWI